MPCFSFAAFTWLPVLACVLPNTTTTTAAAAAWLPMPTLGEGSQQQKLCESVYHRAVYSIQCKPRSALNVEACLPTNSDSAYSTCCHCQLESLARVFRRSPPSSSPFEMAPSSLYGSRSMTSIASARSRATVTHSLPGSRKYQPRWWQRRPILHTAFLTDLQKGSYFAAIFTLVSLQASPAPDADPKVLSSDI